MQQRPLPRCRQVHVALLTELFRQLAVVKPKLRPTVLGCFIANEENATVRCLGMQQGTLPRCSQGTFGFHVRTFVSFKVVHCCRPVTLSLAMCKLQLHGIGVDELVRRAACGTCWTSSFCQPFFCPCYSQMPCSVACYSYLSPAAADWHRRG
jgi:hypothetical protein